MIATAALTIEIVCDHVGRCYVLCVHPVAKLDSAKKHCMLLYVISIIQGKGRFVISLICDNVTPIVRTYMLMGGP